MTYLEMEAMQKAKIEVKRNPFLDLIDAEFERLRRISKLAKTLDPDQRQDFINVLLEEDADVNLVTAQDGK